MQLSSESYKLLYPATIDWDTFCQNKPDVPFSGEVVEYLNALSSLLMKDRESRLYPDVVTFGFFCRKANLLKMKKEYATKDIRLGRGILFHIAPSNVPVNFGYSMVAGLLAGNCNIVRASSKNFPQVNLIVKHMHALQEDGKHGEVARRNVIVKYDHASEANTAFSSIANVRVIWGGDQTIAAIRQHPLPPRSFDVCFADRYSIAVINPQAVMEASDTEMEKLAQNFYNDTYLFDQNACSAPHLVFWLKRGNVETAQNRFWTAIQNVVEQKYTYQDVMSIDKLTNFYKQAVGIKCQQVKGKDNRLMRVKLGQLPTDIEDYRCAGGYFSEYDIEAIDEIARIINLKYQTLAYYGIEENEWPDFVLRNRLMGIDRIVPIGETTNFSLKWDGYNLVQTFSKSVVCI